MVFGLRVRQMARLSLAALIVSAAYPLFSQVVPAATQQFWPLEIGGGLSYFSTHAANKNPNIDYTAFDGSLLGPAAWADWTFRRIPHRLYGLGFEVEGRHLAYGNTGTDARLREDTGEGGFIYKWRHYRNFRPYGKAMAGFGSIDFNNGYPYLQNGDHDTRTFYCPGGGAEFHLMGDLWVRGDYEFELWTHFGRAILEPKGFTVGVSYDMRNFHFGRQKEY
ncbi:MAG: outer membrane beta-barrel protein [Terracidiphilus sp.]